MAFWSGIFGKKKVELDAPPASLATLRTQVFSEEYFGVKVLDRASTAMRPLAPGLVEVIVEDLGGAERTMRWDYLRPFGKTNDELFALARTQAAASETNIASQDLDAIQVMISNSFYLSAFVLEAFSQKVMQKGAFVAPLSWHHWCSHIINDMTVPPHIQMMSLVAGTIRQEMTVTDAERLSTDIYWMKPDRTFEKITFDGEEPVLSRELARTLESFSS